MRLNLNGREFYELQITTTATTGDPIPPDGWEASFDKGKTWKPAVVVVHDAQDWSSWLLAGGDADKGEAVAVLKFSVVPLVRAIDSPELVVKHAPKVIVYS